jgi:hypothetical protein
VQACRSEHNPPVGWVVCEESVREKVQERLQMTRARIEISHEVIKGDQRQARRSASKCGMVLLDL